MRNIYFKLTIAVAALLVHSAGAFPVITNIVEVGGDNEATDTVTAKWTGVTFVGGIANEPVPGLAAGAPYTVGVFGAIPTPAFVDRNHRWTNASDTVLIPEYLRGAEYIMSGNDNRDNATMTAEVFVSRPARVYLIIDNRLSDTSGATPPTFDATHMQWVLDEGWQPVRTGVNRTRDLNLPDEIGIDEGADGTLNQWHSIYVKDFPTSTSILLKQADNAGQNMYGAAVVALPGPLPKTLNIGQNKVGTVTENAEAGSYTILGGGNDIWDQRDEFTYAYTEVTGDFDVQVRVQSLSASANWPKAGIMARETLSEYSRMAFARVTSDQPPGVNDVRFAYRTGLDNVAGASGGQHEDGGGNPSGIPNAWLRLARIGNTVSMSNSADGIAWNLVSSQDTTTWGGGALSNKLYVGLGVSRHGSATTPTVTAEFRNFQFNTNAAPFTVVGAESRGNPNGVRVLFNNPVGAGAFTAGNYILTASGGPNVTTVTGVRFTTANDSPNRDPLTYTLEGTTDDPAVGAWQLIASGDTGLATDPGRNTVGPAVNFANANSYRAYRVLFPTVRDVSANSMQIAEIELLDAGGVDVTAPGDAVVGVVAIAGNSASAIAVAGTAGGLNNYPAGEHPGLAIDNGAGTKYLNFAEVNTGIIVTPAGGTQPGNPVVTAASGGPNANTVQLTVSSLIVGASYELLVDSGVLASDGTSLASAIAVFTHGAGYEARRIHVTHNKTDDGGYYRISDATANAIGDVIALGGGVFSPIETNGVFEDPTPDTGTNERFSTSVYGVLSPTATGNHTFYMSSDDVGRMYLSTDASPANKVQIASEPAWNGVREYIAGGNQGTRGVPPANISLPIPLNAGGRYYMEMSFTEGGGGNNGSATWLPPGGTAVANGTSPIPEQFFAPSRLRDGNSYNTLGPVRVISHPASQTLVALLPATFSVGVDGTPGYTYQWRRNGAAIPGATGRSYTIPAAQLTDDQAVFSVVVANEFSSATSGNATLTVLVPTPPHLLSASADATFTTVTVRFDNRLQVASAQNIANYTLSHAGGPVNIVSATRAANAKDVVLVTAPMAEDTLHTLVVRDVRDETGTTILEPTPTNTTFTTLLTVPGYVLKEYYQNWSGGAGSVDAFIAAQRAGTTPLTQRCLTPLFEQNTADEYENYGGHIAGFFVPTVSGDHVFYFASDDFGRLFMSTDANPTNIREIAREPVWSGRRTWTGEAGGGGRGTPPVNISVPINLTAGQKYYIEGFFTEGGGGDNMGVAVQPPGGAVPVNGDSPITGVNLAAVIEAGALTINTQPQPRTTTVNGLPVFTVVASSTSSLGFCGGAGLGYQWRVNGTDIPGANQASYTAGPVTLANDGDLYSVVVTAPGRSVTSATALLRVVDDTVPPVLLSAKGDVALTGIRLHWSELMSQVIAETPDAYILNGPGIAAPGISPVTAVLVSGGTDVQLTFANALAIGSTYSLEVDFQTDLVGLGPNPVGNPVVDTMHGVVISVQTFVANPGFVLKELYLNTGIGSVAISSLRSDPKYPNSPDLVRYGNLLELNTADEFENYGARLRGWILPPVNGDYVFYMAADDNGEFWLSTDANPANIVNVANEPVWSGRRTWVGEAGGGGRVGVMSPSGGPQANITGPISLVAGQMYYFEAIVKEAGGGDNLGVAWQIPGGPAPANNSNPIEGQYLAALTDPATLGTGPLRIQRSGDSVTLSWDAGSRLQVTASLTPPVVWKDIDTAGATTYTEDPANQFNVNLDTAQSGGGARTGSGSGTIALAGNILTVDVTYSGLSSDRTVDHFHAPAPRGQTAGVAYDLGAITTGVRSGTVQGNVTLVDGAYGGKNVAAQVQDIRAGLWYLNIHTTAFGGGEIRGQVDPPTRFYRLVRP